MDKVLFYLSYLRNFCQYKFSFSCGKLDYHVPRFQPTAKVREQLTRSENAERRASVNKIENLLLAKRIKNRFLSVSFILIIQFFCNLDQKNEEESKTPPRRALVPRCVPSEQILSLHLKYAGPKFRRLPIKLRLSRRFAS